MHTPRKQCPWLASNARATQQGRVKCILYEYRTKTMNVRRSRPPLGIHASPGRAAEVVREGGSGKRERGGSGDVASDEILEGSSTRSTGSAPGCM